MAKVIPIGAPVNDAERQGIAHLRDHLPDNNMVLHNFEVERDGEEFEVDLAVLAPHAVYLIDVKGTRGLIDVYGPKWYPEGRQPYSSPLLKLRSHARSLKGVITSSQPNRRELAGIYVDAVVLLTAPDAHLMDPSGRDAPAVTTLNKAESFFRNAGRIPGNFTKNISGLHNMVLRALQGVAKPRAEPLRFGNWEVVERLGGTDAYTEYRAVNMFAGTSAGTVLLRAYQADPYLPQDEREAQRLRIANAYQALTHMPGHPCIVGARDFFATEAEDRYILVTEDVSGQALRLHIDKPNLALTLDQKLRITHDLLKALMHAHAYQVVHRNLTPSTLLVGSDGHLRLVGFDFARTGTDRSHTIADQIVDELEPAYLAPEVQGEPAAASAASDLFSAGLILYELFTGEPPFSSPTEVFDQGAVFSVKPSIQRSELPAGFDVWLQRLCAFDPDDRPSAATALEALDAIFHPAAHTDGNDQQPEGRAPSTRMDEPIHADIDYSKLQPGQPITHKYMIEQRLGRPGSFGVVYKVIDTLGDVSRAIKLILRDRHSTLERLKKEYQILLRTPEHPNVVKVIDADILPGGGPPFIVFEYIAGSDIGELIEHGSIAPEDVLELGRHVINGLVHLHQHGVNHCDIKPRNVIWTETGAKIIDFNVSVLSEVDHGHGGGSRRYIPPDLDLSAIPQPADLADRDLYALGLTLYEAMTGHYPWETASPPLDRPAPDPRERPGLQDLAPEFVELVLKAIAPKRAARFTSAIEFQQALSHVTRARRIPAVPSDSSSSWTIAGLSPGEAIPPNTNPYVSYLLTLYSQSPHSNAGTRGLDEVSEQTYIETALDRELGPAILSGEFGLLIISGNAGDGKTAFLQNLEQQAQKVGAALDRSLPNGCQFTLNGRTYLTNYDGSQDEGEHKNDDVLRAFFAPYEGNDHAAWPHDASRLIAINEGRLIDFLASEENRFPLLANIARQGLLTGAPAHGVAVVNLNLRSVVANTDGFDGSIFERLIRRLTHKKFWELCHGCDLQDRCYVFHNAITFQDETAGPKIIERLKALYTLTHLRGRLHITLRDLRSSLAFMLAGTRDCAEIHELYHAHKRSEIIKGFYFNSWIGSDDANADRLIALLKDVDVGQATDPRLDRSLDFVSPTDNRSLFRFEGRSHYDRDVLNRLFNDLKRDFSERTGRHFMEAHRRYVAMSRRRYFFERRDENWKEMLTYRTAERMLALIRAEEPIQQFLPNIIRAINRGEGLVSPERLGGRLALQVRQVENGTIRSYQVFPQEHFSLDVRDEAVQTRFVEHMPNSLILRYMAAAGHGAELIINLDIFEMLQRLNEGYRPSIEEEQGYYLSLSVFKNLLSSSPSQEVLLTTSGHEFFGIERHHDGRLEMHRLGMEVD
jgi:serine/threonine protein kinase